ncbi:MAG TPA: glycerol-3-phosphate dehydrogenase/oxidase [Bryobacteraceae bacterium]|nr:glycerol-3-phosphate dehydrogenase/oxidase [Bryobacteraceae bacterium]
MQDRRLANLARLKSRRWDILIVGGGINGAGIARDLMLRNADLKVALVEKNHFASGTSGRNSQLIHGGLRYLKYFDFGLVKEALRERATLMRIAPELVQPLQFLIPCYGAFDRWFYGAGLAFYDVLAGSHGIGLHRVLNEARTSALEPALDRNGLRAGLLFLDGKVHSARLVLENLIDAEARGACIVNYVGARHDNGSIVATDSLTGETFTVQAGRVVDATGAWSTGTPLRLVRGSHLIFPRIQDGEEAIAYFDDGGRIVFLIPWGEDNNLTLVGTTDVDHAGTPDDVRISEEEARYLRSIVHRLFPAYSADPIATYSSLRPLIAATGRSATSTSREHRIWESEGGTLHIAGGKYTTYRSMSEELVDILTQEPCRTATTRLNIPAPPKDPLARVRMAVEREYAQRLADVLFVSTYWGYERVMTAEWLEPLAREMGALLGWDESRIQLEIGSVTH